MKTIHIIRPARKPIRLDLTAYNRPGDFFITCCSFDKVPIFGSAGNNEILLSNTGLMVQKWWRKLPEKFTNIELGDYILMPNHFHGIISIRHDLSVTNGGTEPSIPRIMQWFKTMSTNEFLKTVNPFGIRYSSKLWQRSYYDQIIRNNAEYDRISAYIRNNPKKWVQDRFYKTLK